MQDLVVIHQPDFMPYLGFFHRLLLADTYVILDDAQFTRKGRNSWNNRDKIKTQNGETWLTVTVKKAPLQTKIKDIELSNSIDWKNRNLNILKENYKKSKFFNEIYPDIESYHHNIKTNKLSEFNIGLIEMFIKFLDIDIKIIKSSDLKTIKTSNERIVEILQEVDCKNYLSGIGAKDYYNPDPYEKAGINVIWQKFRHPVYEQLNGPFIPYLSSIDLLFNCGIKESRKILRSV